MEKSVVVSFADPATIFGETGSPRVIVGETIAAIFMSADSTDSVQHIHCQEFSTCF